jgi:hypothetical protein
VGDCEEVGARRIGQGGRGGKREADGMEKATNMVGWMDGRLDGLPI